MAYRDRQRCKGCRRRRQSGKRHQAADATAIDADVTVAAAAERIGLAGGRMVADGGERIECALGGRAGGAEAGKKARQPNEISNHQRNDALPPDLPTGDVAHARCPCRGFITPKNTLTGEKFPSQPKNRAVPGTGLRRVH